jgi:hypothetical protein
MKPLAIWLGLRVGLWLCALPLRLHWYGLPGLLARLTPQGELVPSQRGLDVDSVAWVTGCVCRRRLFHSGVFAQPPKKVYSRRRVLSKLDFCPF